jgi:protoporphyrinogen oxidase
MSKIAILGSGMAGFGAVHQLHSHGVESVLFEKRAWHGGHTASYQLDNGFVLDEGPHVSFTKEKRIQDLLAGNIDQKYETLQTKVNNHWKGHWIKHPAQVNLHGLPDELVVKILKEFIALQTAEPREAKNYEEWLKLSFGPTFAETFPMQYTIKYHTTTADNMTTDWVGPRLYRPVLDEVLRGAISPKTPEVHYISGFRYPTHGGFVAYLEPFTRQTELKVSHEVTRIDPKAKRITFSNGATFDYGHVISSIPLPDLIPLIAGAPKDVLEAAANLACSQVVIVSIGVDRPDLIDAHWTYFYDHDYFFTRLSTPHLQSPNNVPPGCGSIQAECYYSDKYRPLDRKPEDCIEPVIADLRRCGILRDSDKILLKHAMHLRYANVIFDLDRTAALATVHGFLKDVGIEPAGRYGEWGYLWTDEAFMSGERAAERVLGCIAKS